MYHLVWGMIIMQMESSKDNKISTLVYERCNRKFRQMWPRNWTQNECYKKNMKKDYMLLKRGRRRIFKFDNENQITLYKTVFDSF